MGDRTDRRPTTCYCFYLGDTLIFDVARNNMLFFVPGQSLNIVLWLMPLQNYYGFFVFLLIWGFHKGHPLFFIVITIMLFRLHTMMYFMNEQHIDNDCYFVRHHLQSNTLHLHIISITDQPADIFTKVLRSPFSSIHSVTSKT